MLKWSINYNLFRRRAQFRMLQEPHTSSCDAEIVELIREMHSESPTLGISMVIKRLRSRALEVSKDRVTGLTRVSDPLSVALRLPGGATKQRPYFVPCPNTLWYLCENDNCVCHNAL